MDRVYIPQNSEDEIYRKWEQSRTFKPLGDDDKMFSIAIPPPNVTGTLHAGHAMYVLQDIMVRWNRMRWRNSLYVPGTDHAAIATESVVLRNLGITDRNKEISREDFLKEAEKWTQKSHDRIIHQLKKLGLSCDWDREAYTFDAERNYAVNTIFKMLYEKGLIYRGNRMINWSVGAQSVLADDEVEWAEKTEPFYYLRCGEFIIGTVRPETKCADSPLVVSETGIYVRVKYSSSEGEGYFILSQHLFEDEKQRKKVLNLLDSSGTFECVERFFGKELEGKEFEYNTYAGKRRFRVIADDRVIDMEKGAGAMTISSCHSADDYDLAKRKQLDDTWIQKIDFEGKMTSVAGPCAGMNIVNARKRSAEIMKTQGLLVGEDVEYVHRVPLCYRSHTVVEPMVSKQWFISVEKEFGAEKQKRLFFVQKEEGRDFLAYPERRENIVQVLKKKHITKILYEQGGSKVAEMFSEELHVPAEERKELQELKEVYYNSPLFDGEDGYSGYEEDFLKAKELLQKWKEEDNNTILVIGDKVMLATIFAVLKDHPYRNFSEYIDDFGVEEYEEDEIPTGKIEKTTLKKQMQNAVRQGYVDLVPQRFEKIYYHWIDNLRDWCISRQIWWGHRIPVWYDKKGEVAAVGFIEELKRKKMNLVQDEDTLDTWFSSALWPFSIFGWPNQTDDLKRFYPTSVLETGHDILFFWVARMIMFGKFATNKYPFRTVYLHGLVQDEKGQKMSKSKGNGIDPLDLIEEFGTDAFRLSLVMGTTPGNNAHLGKEKIAGCRNFCNKLWNISRFILLQENVKRESYGSVRTMTDLQEWILIKTDALVESVDACLRQYQFGVAAEKIWNFTWSEFADWAIEAAKVENSPITNGVLRHTLEILLRLLHPFIPFVTEKIWERCEKKYLLIKFSYPEKRNRTQFSSKNFTEVIKVIEKIRSMRKLAGVDPTKKVIAFLHVDVDKQEEDILKNNSNIIEALSRLESLSFSSFPEEPGAIDSVGNIQIFLPDRGMIDPKAEKIRLEKELQKAEKVYSGLQKKLGSQGFLQKAPPELVEQSRQQAKRLQEKIDLLGKRLSGDR
jgi:valyl-tRNA synthetase